MTLKVPDLTLLILRIEYPYPYAMHECFDVYRLLHETKGSVLGMLKGKLSVVLSGDSA